MSKEPRDRYVYELGFRVEPDEALGIFAGHWKDGSLLVAADHIEQAARHAEKYLAENWPGRNSRLTRYNTATSRRIDGLTHRGTSPGVIYCHHVDRTDVCEHPGHYNLNPVRRIRV